MNGKAKAREQGLLTPNEAWIYRYLLKFSFKNTFKHQKNGVFAKKIKVC